jgi:hypothetical protein
MGNQIPVAVEQRNSEVTLRTFTTAMSAAGLLSSPDALPRGLAETTALFSSYERDLANSFVVNQFLGRVMT